MKKNTTIIIKNNHSKLGEKGNIVKVASGYAFNYLIPNNFAELATKGKIRHAKMLQDIKDKRLAKDKIYANNIQKKLEQIYKISISKTVGENQQIFGKISEKEILSKIFLCSGQKLDKKQISLPDIKKLGIYEISIQIFTDINAYIKLQILPQDLNIYL